MARPQKVGLDYFPLDVGALSDPKLRAARQEYGYLAVVVYLSLLCILYRDKGYYIEYSEEAKYDVVSTIMAEVLIGKYQPTPETIEKVIDRLVACRLFSRDLYQRGLITSKRAQATYYRATVDRKAISVDWSIWLLEESEMSSMSSRSVILSSFINRSINSVNQSNNLVNQSINPQRKVNESRVKESKVKQRKEGVAGGTSVASVIADQFIKSFGREPDNNFLRTAELLITEHRPLEWTLDAIAEAGNKSDCKNPEAYALGVIKLYEPKQRNAAPADRDPTGPLKSWEQDWLEEIRARRERQVDNLEESAKKDAPKCALKEMKKI